MKLSLFNSNTRRYKDKSSNYNFFTFLLTKKQKLEIFITNLILNKALRKFILVELAMKIVDAK